MELHRNINRTVIVSFFALFLGTSAAQAHHESETLPLRAGDAADTCVANSQQIRVTVKGTTHKGLLKVELYKPDDKFLKDESRKVRLPAKDGPMMVCLNIDAPGTFAVTGYHDLDADRSLDKSWNFKPKEPFGVVNAETLKEKKRPKFEQVSFEVGPKGADVILILVDPKEK